MATYLPRVVDHELTEILTGISAVALEGAKGVGKTATATRRAVSIHRLDEPAKQAIATADPTVLLNDPPPILFDEWQKVPAVWDVVRRAVDDAPTPSRFLLTGSAAPAAAPTHSGAGRIVRVRMRPLALNERGLGSPTVSLGDLLTGTHPHVEGRAELKLVDYAEEILRSGFPGIRALPGRARRTQLDGYLNRIVDRDFDEQGHRVRRPEALLRWMTAYAAATATTTSLEKIRNAASGGTTDVPAKTTVLTYRDVLERLWILDSVPGWSVSRSHLSRLTLAPKHHLADPALAARLLGTDAGALLEGVVAGADLRAQGNAEPLFTPRDGTLLGQLFESLLTLSVRTYAQHSEASVFHLRTRDGRQEVDLIVERADHRIAALEVKLSAEVTDDDVRHLLWLRDQLGDDLLDMIVITTGSHAYRRPDGIAVVPAVLLGP
jgi:uncharacterized protein